MNSRSLFHICIFSYCQVFTYSALQIALHLHSHLLTQKHQPLGSISQGHVDLFTESLKEVEKPQASPKVASAGQIGAATHTESNIMFPVQDS